MKYRLYIDYGKGYQNEKEHTIPSIVKKLDNTYFQQFLIIQEKDNQDIPLLHGYGYEYRELVEKPKVKEKKIK